MNNALSDLLIVTDGDIARLAPLGPDALLKGELERAIVVSSEAVPPDVVIMDSRVLYTDETTGVRRRISIVLPHEADGAGGRVSVLAPVGTALLGLSAGQVIEWGFPDGTRHRLRVDDVMQERRGTPSG